MWYTPKTQATGENVFEFLDWLDDYQTQQDCYQILEYMWEVSGEAPEMWGDAIVGFWRYHYKTKSGCESDWMRIAFSPRKNYISIYIMPGYSDFYWLLDELGKHKAGRSCLNIKQLSDINWDVLERIIQMGWDKMEEEYPSNS